MVLILECFIICFILLVPCVVAIANGVHNAAFLYERDVQDRVVKMGLITKERLELMVMLHGGRVCYRGALPVAEEMAKVFPLEKEKR